MLSGPPGSPGFDPQRFRMCTVKCKDPLKPVGGNTGLRRCLMQGGLAQFEPPPDCLQPCETPDHKDGTLDVSRRSVKRWSTGPTRCAFDQVCEDSVHLV
eukprot:g28159.t1